MLKAFQNVIWDMGCRFFGTANMTSRRIRGMRLFEEAAEVTRACGSITREEMHQIVDMVCDKEKGGDLYYELGDLLITVSALSSQCKFDIDELIEFNVCRCLKKDPKEMAERNRLKEERGLK